MKKITNNIHKRKADQAQDLLQEEIQSEKPKKQCVQKKSSAPIKFSQKQPEEEQQQELSEIQEQDELFQQLSQSQHSLNQLLAESQHQKLDKAQIKKGFQLTILPPEIKPEVCFQNKYGNQEEKSLVFGYKITKSETSGNPDFYVYVNGKKVSLKLTQQQYQFLGSCFESMNL